MENLSNVSEVAALRLCNSCGGCKWICPVSAIQYIETVGGYLIPEIDSQACNQCGLCISICPGVHFGSNLISAMPPDPFIGNVLAAYVGIAYNPKIFNHSQSGGVVTALLASAINRGEIGGAVNVVMSDECPTRPQVVLSKSIQDLICAQKSKYCAVPLLGILDDVKKNGDPVAVVGIPCQLHGLWNILELFPNLRDKIAFTIGLVCDRIMTYAAISYLIEKSGIPENDVSIFHFRDKTCGGYPGNVHAVSKDGISIVMPSRKRTQIKDFFTPARCRLCFDKMNVFADIVVGDPHGISGINRQAGESAVIVRTSNGERIFEEAIKSGDLSARAISLQEVVAGQSISAKRADWTGFVSAWEKRHWPLPDYCSIAAKHATSPSKVRWFDKNLEHSILLDSFASRKALMRYIKRKLLYYNAKRILATPFRLFRGVRKKVEAISNRSFGGSH